MRAASLDASRPERAAGLAALGGRRARRGRRGARPRRAVGLALLALTLGAATVSVAPRQDWGERLEALEGWLADPDEGLRSDAALELEDVVLELRDAVFDPPDPDTTDRPLDALAWALVLRDGVGGEAGRIETELERLGALGAHELGARVADAVALRLQARQDYERAIAVLETAERAFPRSNGGGLVYVRARLAQLSRLLGRYERAWKALADAGADLPEIQAEENRLAAGCNLLARRIELLLGLGLPDIALPLIAEQEQSIPRLTELEQGRTRVAAVEARVFEHTALVHRLDALIGLARLEEAERRASEALEGLDGRFRALVKLRRAVARVELARFDPERWSAPALEALAEALDDPGLETVERLQAQSRLADLRWAFGPRDEVDGLLSRVESELAGLPARPLDLELYAADLRARITLESGAERDVLERATTRLEDAYGRFLTAWHATPQREGGVPFLHYAVRRRMLGTLIRLATSLHEGDDGVREALGHLERTQRLGSLVRFAPRPSGTLDEALELLVGKGRGLLAYVPARDAVHLLLADGAGFAHRALPDPEGLEALRSELETQASGAGLGLSEAAGRRLRATAEALGDRLLPAEVAGRVAGWSELTVVGADLLGYTPFELLPVGGKPLGERSAVTYLPSLPLAGLLDERLRDEARQRPVALHLVAAPVLSADVRARWERLAPIPFDAERRAELVGAFDASEVCVLASQSATRRALDAPLLDESVVLGLLTHGVHDYQRERSAGLVLTPVGEEDPGLLWCEDVERLHAPPLVVVLACGSGRGPTRKGEDAVGHLGGAFLAAGAYSVVLSPFDLDSEVALRLGAQLFERVRRHGDSPAEALRHARAALAADGDLTAQAAAFVHVVGLGGRPLF